MNIELCSKTIKPTHRSQLPKHRKSTITQEHLIVFSKDQICSGREGDCDSFKKRREADAKSSLSLTPRKKGKKNASFEEIA